MKTSKITTPNNSWTWLITMLIALTAGGVGGYFSYSYFTSPGLSILNEITPDLMNRARPIIQEAKMVVVEQNNQVQAVASKLSGNLLAINKKLDQPSADWQKNFYDPGQRVAEAIPLTSDGWLVTNFNQLNDDLGRTAKKFVIISSDGTIFEIEKAVRNNFTNTTFVKISSHNLPVSKLADTPLGKNGNLLVGASFDGSTENFYQVAGFTGTTSAIKSPDNRNKKITINGSAKNYLALVNLSSEIEAFVSPTEIISARTINRDFTAFLKNKRIGRTWFGFHYLVPGSLAAIKRADPKITGIILYSDDNHVWPKNGPAVLAGLKNGDNLIAINGTNITADNLDGLFDVEADTMLKFTIKRQGRAIDINFKTGELK